MVQKRVELVADNDDVDREVEGDERLPDVDAPRLQRVSPPTTALAVPE